MNHLLAIALGGAVGASGRYLVSNWMTNIFGNQFPWGTLTVNVLGSLCMGVAYVVFMEKWVMSTELRALISIGFLGAFTTFSTFSLETLSMLMANQWIKAGAYILASVLVCLAATWIGLKSTRLIIG